MKKLSLIIAALLVAIIEINAQQYATDGTIEFGGSVSYTNVTGVVDGESVESSLNQITLVTPLYYFLTDGYSLGLVPALEYYNLEGSSTFGLGFFLSSAYNFNLESNVFPYIEARIGYNSISTSVSLSGADESVSLSGLGWSVIGGIKTQVGGNALLNFGIGYAQQTLEADGYEGDRTGRNIIAFNIGIFLFFNETESK